jgi:hypothetical protein
MDTPRVDAPDPYAPPGAEVATRTLPTLARLASLATILLWCHMPWLAITTALSVWRVLGGGEQNPFDAAGLAQIFITCAGAMLWVISAGVFLWWTYVACARVRMTRPESELSPVWGVASWFVPFANLVAPLLVLRSLWSWSQPPVDGSQPRAPAYTIVWWLAWILPFCWGGAVAILAVASQPWSNSMRTIVIASNLAQLAAHVEAILLAVRFVREVTAMQRETFGVE